MRLHGVVEADASGEAHADVTVLIAHHGVEAFIPAMLAAGLVTLHLSRARWGLWRERRRGGGRPENSDRPPEGWTP